MAQYQWLAWIVLWFFIGLTLTLDFWEKGNKIYAVGIAIVSMLCMTGGFMILLGA